MKKLNYENHDEWLKLRKAGIGGSDIASICGINKFHTAMDVYMDKINPTYSLPDNDYLWWGREIEPLVAKKFSEVTGKKVVNDNHILIDDTFDFFYANIDRKIVGEKSILECKTTNSMNKTEWEDKKIPEMYYCQLQWYLGITGYQKAYIACLLGDKTFIYKECLRDENVIDSLREKAYNFWTYYVMTNTPPPAVAGDEQNLNSLYPNEEGQVDLSDMLDVFNERSVLESDIKQRKDELKAMENELKNYNATIKQKMENKTNGYCGIYNVINKVSYQKRVDGDKLKSLYPNIYDECLKEIAVNKFSVKELI